MSHKSELLQGLCHSWRDETIQFLCLDAFYDGHDENAKAFAKEWVEKNDDQIGKKIHLTNFFDNISRETLHWLWQKISLVHPRIQKWSWSRKYARHCLVKVFWFKRQVWQTCWYKEKVWSWVCVHCQWNGNWCLQCPCGSADIDYWDMIDNKY